MYRCPTLLDTHVFPCKMCQRIPEQDEDLDLFLLVCGSNTETRMFRILTGLYHSFVHRDNNDRQSIIWTSETMLVRDLLTISNEFVRKFNKGIAINDSIKCVLQTKISTSKFNKMLILISENYFSATAQ